VVSSAGGVEEGEALLHHYYLACLRSMVATRLEVLVRHPWGLLDVLEWWGGGGAREGGRLVGGGLTCCQCSCCYSIQVFVVTG
jgi:hypothetical protein